MRRTVFNLAFLTLVLVFVAVNSAAQEPVIRLPRGTVPRTVTTTDTSNRNLLQPGGRKPDSTSSVERRDYSDDSLRIRYFTFSNFRTSTFDSSISDFTTRYPVPGTHVFLGNTGTASRSILFSPVMRSGFDPGFHSLDVYKLRLNDVRFFTTPKPYTEIGYMLASQSEQLIDVMHTQNIKPYWNVALNYRLISAPGFFRSQKSNHNNYLIASWYQSPNRRYNNYTVILSNNMQVAENGGIKQDIDYLSDPTYTANRFTIPTNLGGNSSSQPDFFSNALTTGHKERESSIFIRQQYDLGRKDSLVTDSTVIPLFYPRLRFEHSFRRTKYSYTYQDYATAAGQNANAADSGYYDKVYGIKIRQGDSILLQDTWREVNNDFSIYQFPDAKNLQQFIKVGTELQLLSGTFLTDKKSYVNIIGHGEYRNRSKNRKWDILATGRLHLAGLNIGDYHFYGSLQRQLSQQLGTLQLGFENVLRSPAFNFNQRSSFYLDVPKSFGKENSSHFFAAYTLPRLNLRLQGNYYLVSNYLYISQFYKLQQENAFFNVLRVTALKTTALTKHINLHTEVYLQQKAGGAEVALPTLFTRNRLAYEGRFFRNLNLSAGVELRYHTPYNADGYSAVLGQFFYQDSVTISNRPEVHLYTHFRIRTLKAFIRFENLNTATTKGGLQFIRNNFAAPAYPTPGLVFRFGIWWTFIN